MQPSRGSFQQIIYLTLPIGKGQKPFPASEGVGLASLAPA